MHGKARLIVSLLEAGSHSPPRYPMTSYLERCAWKSATNWASSDISTKKGWDEVPTDPTTPVKSRHGIWFRPPDM